MRIGSLFSGIGGLERGVIMANPEAVVCWQAESDQHALAVLERHWPTVKRYVDVRMVDETAAPVDVVCGGFPCQPHSYAGKRHGVSDERWLWPEFARVVGCVKPSFVFVENVPGLRTSGLRNVLADLAALGFDAEWDMFGAYEAGAHFQGDRLYLLAKAHKVNGALWLGVQREDRKKILRDSEEDGPGLGTPPVGLATRENDVIPRRVGIQLLGNAVYAPQAALAWRALMSRLG